MLHIPARSGAFVHWTSIFMFNSDTNNGNYKGYYKINDSIKIKSWNKPTAGIEYS